MLALSPPDGGEGTAVKLVRYGAPGAERPGLIDGTGALRALDGVLGDIDGAALAPESLARLRELAPEALPRVEGAPRLGPCVARPPKLIGIGLNYADHAEEAGLAAPAEPIVFLKATSAVAGPFDDLPLPPGAEKLDWEVELGVVIGSRAKRVAQAEALSAVAGYCVVNDVSERAWQGERGGQWTKGKSHDGFAPIGPWLVTADAIPDPQKLDLWLSVDGEMRQRGSTANMIFGVAALVSAVSEFMTLEPGDVIATGTPEGVGPLTDGDRVEVEIEGVGTLEHEVRQAE